MPEALVNRRLILHITLLTLVILFFVCIYRMENVYDGDFTLKKFVTWNIQQGATKDVSRSIQPVSNGTRSKLPSYMCYKNEPFIVLERCITCSQFERNALTAAYCLETGFYDKVNCPRSKQLGLKPCYENTNRSAQFNVFMSLSAFCSVVSYGFVNWRQSALRKQGFIRIEGQLN